MGSLLILFVPQKCEELVDNSGSTNGEYETVICSISHNLHKTDDTFHNITLGFNFLCVGLFLLTYVIELRRENWCVKYLDINHDFPDPVIILAKILRNHIKLVGDGKLNVAPGIGEQFHQFRLAHCGADHLAGNLLKKCRSLFNGVFGKSCNDLG